MKFVISSVVEKNEQGREVCYLRAKNVRDILVNEYSIDAECLTLEEVDALDDEPANIVLIKKK